MIVLLLIKTIHYLCLAALLYSSVMKNWLLRSANINLTQIQRLRRFDKLSGAAAGVILLTGLTMLMWLAKPTGYYLTQPLFIFKISIFVIASSLIVVTKIAFKQALANTQAAWTVPRTVKVILAIDLVGLLAMGFFGYSVAH